VGPYLDPQLIAACASLDVEDLVTDPSGPVMASVGLPFALAEVSGLSALARARPNTTVFVTAFARYPQVDERFSLFLYTHADRAASLIRARMFAPLTNTLEDPATGAASATLGAYLVSLRPEPTLRTGLVIEQGVEMGRRSVIECEMHKANGKVQDVFVQGRCVLVMRGTIDV